MDNDTQPAGASAEFSATPIGDVLDSNPRHQVQERHEPAREAGVAHEPEPAPAPAAQPPAAAKPAAAKPSAQAAPPPASPQPAPAGQAGDPQPDPNAPKEPKWYREHMQKVNRELAASRQELERLRSGRQPPPQQRQDQPAFPDPIEDPEGYHAAVSRSFERRQQEFELRQTLSISERFARREHGGEAFEDCRAWLSTKPDLADWCAMQPDPWDAAFTLYKREQLADEIGDDPSAWRERERARIRAEVEAEMAAGREDEPPRHEPARRTMTRQPPPAPASTVRNSAGDMGRDGRGRFTGPTSMRSILSEGRPAGRPGQR